MGVAMRTNALVVPSFDVRRRGPYHTFFVTEPLSLIDTGNSREDDLRNQQLFLTRLEEFISRFPDQWFWRYKWWKFSFTKRFAVLEDERAGHRIQAQAVASAWEALRGELDPEYEFEFQHVPVRYRSPWRRRLLMFLAPALLPFAQGRFGVLKWFLSSQTVERLENAHFDFIISSGAGLVPLNLWLARENLAKSIVVMRPPFPYSRHRFDLVVMPGHDRPIGSRSACLRTHLAPNLVDENFLSRVSEEWRSRVRRSA
jgi:hypothetical protein